MAQGNSGCLIDDCMAGRVDMVVTKSISRFARNTLDCLKYIRQLKDKNIAVFFEKEAINTLDAKGEVLLTIMASLAQQESQSLSQNVRLGLQYRYQQGKVQVCTNRFLGYDKDEDGNLVINPEEAEVVKRIYREYLGGKSYYQIGQELSADGFRTAAGNDYWLPSTLKKILTKLRTTDLIRRKRQHPLKTACYKGFCGQGGAFRLMCGAGKRAGMRIGPCTMDTITL